MTPASAQHRVLITISVMVASIMQALDATIANVALPRIQGSLSATQDQIAWVLTSYIIATAIMMPLSGWLAGQFGRKKVFAISIAFFTFASVLCGLAQTLPEMVVFRALQGIGGAALVPMSQAVLLDINPPEHHGRAMAVWGMGVVLGPIIGPALGGWLTDDYNWRWVFYINVPFGILSFLGVLSFLGESARRRTRFDFFGFATLSIALGSLQMMLDRGSLKDWFASTEIWAEATIAALAFYLFVVHTETARAHPFVSPGLFRDRNFVTGNLFVFIVGVVLFATLALLPPLLQEHMNYPVFLTGLITAPRGIGTLLSMVIVGRLVGRVPTRYLILFGLLLTIISLWQMAGFSLLMDGDPIIWSGFIQGVGTGFVYVPLAAVTFATLKPELRNEATALFNLTRNIGSSIGISVVEALLVRNTQVMHVSLAAHLTRYTGAHAATAASALAALNHEVTEQASMIAYNDDFKLMMILTILVIPFAFLLRDVRRPKEMAVVME
jgi:MFS transporter, DHA2 family, multidrug resistance protein